MLITTLTAIPGKTYEVLGLVRGTFAMCDRDSFYDIVNDVTEDMVHQAAMLGADAVVDVRYETLNCPHFDKARPNAPLCIAYGTAVHFIG